MPDENKIKEYLVKLEANLDVYDLILSAHAYLAGDVCRVLRCCLIF